MLTVSYVSPACDELHCGCAYICSVLVTQLWIGLLYNMFIFVSLVTSSKLCITFKGYFLVSIAACSPSHVVFIPFLPSEAKTVGHRRKSGVHQDVSRKKCQISKYWKVHVFLRWLFSLHVVASCLVELVCLSFVPLARPRQPGGGGAGRGRGPARSVCECCRDCQKQRRAGLYPWLPCRSITVSVLHLSISRVIPSFMLCLSFCFPWARLES